jgi:hypothetical protein
VRRRREGRIGNLVEREGRKEGRRRESSSNQPSKYAIRRREERKQEKRGYLCEGEYAF